MLSLAKKMLYAIIISFSTLQASSAFSAQPTFVLGSLRSIFGMTKQIDENAEKRRDLCQALLKECRAGTKDRKLIEVFISELELLNPTTSSATSSLLQKEWLLEWTTEKEIIFFSDFGISGDITQTISGAVLGNTIDFKKGGGLSVVGELIPDEALPLRTNFQFKSASIDFGFAKFDIPPVGEGWFDTVYLDEVIRIDTNSRDDILICTPKA